jgi:rhodanese-related sulfurtransferase
VKFFIDNSWLIALALISGGALAWPLLQRRGQRISILQATQLINQGKGVLIDVREPAEFAAGHVRDSRNIPVKELGSRIAELDKDKAKGRAAIVICQSGVRSAGAAAQLKKAGFAEAYTLDGGIAAWQAQGLPTVKQA